MSRQPRWDCCNRRRTVNTTSHQGGCKLCLHERLAKGRQTNADLAAARRGDVPVKLPQPAGTRKPLRDPRKFGCGHPRSATNTMQISNRVNGCCRQCETAKQKVRDARRKEKYWENREAEGRQRVTSYGVPRLVRTPSQPLDLSNDPARLLYLAEKARRASKPSPAIEEARAHYAAQLQREAESRKGGRPKGQTNFGGRPNQMGNLRAVDPADALIAALGRFEGAA